MSHVDDGTLHAYLDGELSPAEAQGVDAHLAQCPGCRERLDEERALIARAGELLALATPPDRAVPPPPFRPGDFTPPLRLWWRVRLPLAWAATVALALGIGWYVGGEGFSPRSRPPAPAAARDANAPEPRAPAVAARPPRPSRAAARPASREADAVAPHPVTGAALPTPPAFALEQRAVRESLVLAPTAGGQAPAVAIAPLPSLVAGKLASSDPITLDSARILLDHDPLAVPGLPIRAVRRERALGEVVVVVEQVLDSGTVIELRERRPLQLQLGAVVVTGAAEARDRLDSAADRAAARPKMAAAPPAEQRLVEERGRPVLQAAGLRVEISGPLPADSLKRLLKRVQPVKP